MDPPHTRCSLLLQNLWMAATEIARKERKTDVTWSYHPNQITPIYPPQHHCTFTPHDHMDIYGLFGAWPLAVNRFDSRVHVKHTISDLAPVKCRLSLGINPRAWLGNIGIKNERNVVRQTDASHVYGRLSHDPTLTLSFVLASPFSDRGRKWDTDPLIDQQTVLFTPISYYR